jgi:hypothetical protein
MSSPGNAFFCLLLAFSWASVQGQESLYRKNYTDAGDTFIEIESVFGKVARHGSLPYLITIRNNSGQNRVWTIRLSEGSAGRSLTTSAIYHIAVENGSERRREITLAFAPAFLAYDYRNLTVTVGATGFATETRHLGEQTNQSFPGLAISQPLAQRSLARLDDAVRKENSSNQNFAKPFDISSLPSEWDGYSGLDGLLIDLDSWLSLSLVQRQAILAWVRLGGMVDVYAEEGVTFSDLKLQVNAADPAATELPMSFGSIRLRRWAGGDLPDNVISQYRHLAQRSATLESDFDSDSEWPLKKPFGSREFNPVFVFVLLVIFAILVAPVNLFYFARAGRRHRLFITTPIISVVTCLLIIVMILFTDGVGGRGVRALIADLQPSREEMRLYLTQEQISRTGVMVKTGFSSDLIDDINPVRLTGSNFNAFPPTGNRSTSYEISGDDFSGGFFPSRTEQGFVLRSAEPTRSRIELIAPATEFAAPQLTSNLPLSITGFYYLDHRGQAWHSLPEKVIEPGQKIPLEKAGDRKWPEWLEEDTDFFSNGQRSRLRRLNSEPNRFFARVNGGESLALATHPGIRWGKTVVVLTGTPTTGRAAPAPAPETPAALEIDAR